MSAARWVFLADPTDYGWTELAAQGSAVWDGIRNARAQANLRRCQVGDLILIYHTAPDKALVGIARVQAEARPDPAAAERVVVDVVPVVALARPLPLAELKQDDVLREMSFVRMPRVAVWPVTPAQWERVLRLSGTDAAAASGGQL
jgi:predicted RNA-binding protein with PUA-like domain